MRLDREHTKTFPAVIPRKKRIIMSKKFRFHYKLNDAAKKLSESEQQALKRYLHRRVFLLNRFGLEPDSNDDDLLTCICLQSIKAKTWRTYASTYESMLDKGYDFVNYPEHADSLLSKYTLSTT